MSAEDVEHEDDAPAERWAPERWAAEAAELVARIRQLPTATSCAVSVRGSIICIWGTCRAGNIVDARLWLDLIDDAPEILAEATAGGAWLLILRANYSNDAQRIANLSGCAIAPLARMPIE